jgi:hypothetical protein
MDALHTLTAEAKAELHARAGFLQEDADKIAKAVKLMEEGRIERVLDKDDHYEVVGMSGSIYTTSPKACSCKARRSPETPFPCYHMLGLALYRWVADAMQQQGHALFAEEPTLMTPFQTSQDGQEGQDTHKDDRGAVEGANTALRPQEGLKTAHNEQQQRQDIRRLLILYGLKPTTRSDYEAATLTHTDLPLLPENFAAIIERLESLVTARKAALPSPKLLSDYMVDIKGKRHIQYGGLLAYAHEQGLLSLSASLTTVSKDLAIATATATFKDGRTFTETADATPDNVGPQIKQHFMRMAVTRAKARALRDALNISEAAAEELGD